VYRIVKCIRQFPGPAFPDVVFLIPPFLIQ